MLYQWLVLNGNHGNVLVALTKVLITDWRTPFSFIGRLTGDPVPMETIHSIGLSGHKLLASWIAIPVGLLATKPPS